MAGETTITVRGQLTADPELRYTQGGTAVVNFTVAATTRTYNNETRNWEDDNTSFWRATAWREEAEHIAGSLKKGNRVIVYGRVQQKSYETKEGEKRTSFEIEVDEIGASLKYATAEITRVAPATSAEDDNQPL